MNWFLGIAIILMVLLVLAIILAACKATSIADQRMEQIFAERMASRPEEEAPE